MKRVVFLILLSFIFLVGCSNESIFNGDFKDFGKAVTKEEWEKEKNNALNKSPIKTNFSRDFSIEIVENNISNTYENNELIDNHEKLDKKNVNYDNDYHIYELIKNDDYSWKYYKGCKNSNTGYEVIIVDQKLYSKSKFPSTDNEILNEALNYYLKVVNRPFEFDEKYFDKLNLTNNLNYEYFINIFNSNVFTYKITGENRANNMDFKVEYIFQYVFNEKYVVLNYKNITTISIENTIIEYVDKFSSYILMEEVTIFPFDV